MEAHSTPESQKVKTICSKVLNSHVQFVCRIHFYKYLIVSLVFSHLGFWSGNLFLIAPFPDLCLLVPFYCGSICFMFSVEAFAVSAVCMCLFIF